MQVLSIDGKTPSEKERLNNSANWIDISLLSSFEIFVGMLFGPTDRRGSRDKIMFLISVLPVGLMKKGVYVNLRKEIKEFISRLFYGRFNASFHIGKVVVECISNVFRVI